MKRNAFLLAHLKQFVGKRITKVELTPVGQSMADDIPSMEFDDGTFAMVWCDPEGNGPGHIGLYDKTGGEIRPGMRPSNN